MLFSTPVVTIFTLALAFSTNAQSSSSASSSAAPAATSALPSCVASCQASAAILAGCAGAKDIPCICSIQKKTLFQTSVDNCVNQQCGADAGKDVTAANNQQSSICLAYASGLAGKPSATSGSSSSSNAAGSVRPLALDGLRAVGAGLVTVVVGVVLGATAL